MDVVVTKHAVQRYRERLFDYSSSDEEIEELLIMVARHGKRVLNRPSSFGDCFEVKHKDISIVLVNDHQDSIVLTCLGDRGYRKWIKSQDTYIKVCGRVLYPITGT